ncbi:Arylsulfatase [Hondaea fermentalgiana]|uniref:Arylsulfatase n=1 Tax=Hondaea fermentalgiana TaxID=2315210 RepID=A0A2R5G9W6_9STRA|nr:Arylsulfatase [Hondaea fermentalgiana]|eukprot:GBG26528.1 Arylsulfatase [Hondaea fermentalgiana]
MPNYESVAANGVDFTNGHSHASLCSPSRYTLLTGQYYFRANPNRNVVQPDHAPFINETVNTFPGMLQDEGYKTYMVGKWHVGMDMPDDLATGEIYGGPLDGGFDRYFGIAASMGFPYLSYIQDRTFTEVPDHYTIKEAAAIQSCPGGLACKTWGLGTCLEASFENLTGCGSSSMWRTVEEGSWHKTVGKTFDPHYVLSNLTSAATSYIEHHVNQYGSDVPFFLYMAMTGDHLPHTPHPDWEGTTDYGWYADLLEELDYRLGQTIDVLTKHNLLNDTLLIVTSDNGPEAKGKYVRTGLTSTDVYAGQKTDLQEGGNRIPFIVQWPNVMPKGITFDYAISQVDFFRTFADMLGISLPS